MASIGNPTKKKKGLWSVRIRFSDTTKTPQRLSVTINHPHKTQVLLIAEQLVQTYYSGSYDPWTDTIDFHMVSTSNKNTVYTLSKAVQDYFLYVIESKKWNPNTLKTHKYVFDKLIEHVGPTFPIHKIQQNQVESLFRDWNISYISAQRNKGRLETFFKWLNLAITIPINKKKQIPSIIYFTRDDITALKKTIIQVNLNKNGKSNNANGRTLYLIRFLEFLFLTGFRRSEALNLKVKHIDTVNKTLYLPTTKGFKEEIIPYGPIKPLERIIHAQIRKLKRIGKYHPEQLFWEHRGHERVSRTIKRYIRLTFPEEKANRLKMHSIRHGTATHLLNSGVDLPFIQHYMRHNDIRTTNNYAKVIKAEAYKQISHVFNDSP